MKQLRWAVAGLLGVVGVGAVVTVVSAETRGRWASAQLLSQVLQLDGAQVAQAQAAESFAVKVAPLLDSLEALHKQAPRDEKERPLCDRLAAGKPVAPEAAARCRSFLDARRSALASVLQVASLAHPGLPLGMNQYGDPRDPLTRDGFVRFLDLLRADAVLVHDEVAAGEGQAAVRHCLDGLRLSRLLAHGGGLLGAMTGYSGYEVLFAPCAQAIGSGDPRNALQAADELKDGRAEIPPLSEAMAFDNVVGDLGAFGRFLSETQRAQLPKTAQAIADLGVLGPLPWYGRWFALDAFDRLPPLLEETRSAVDLPREERKQTLAVIADQAHHSWNPVVKAGYADYSQFADRLEQQLVSHDLLLALAELRTEVFEHGRWPDQVPALYDNRPHWPTDVRLTARGDNGHALVAVGPLQPLVVPFAG